MAPSAHWWFNISILKLNVKMALEVSGFFNWLPLLVNVIKLTSCLQFIDVKLQKNSCLMCPASPGRQHVLYAFDDRFLILMKNSSWSALCHIFRLRIWYIPQLFKVHVLSITKTFSNLVLDCTTFKPIRTNKRDQ